MNPIVVGKVNFNILPSMKAIEYNQGGHTMSKDFKRHWNFEYGQRIKECCPNLRGLR